MMILVKKRRQRKQSRRQKKHQALNWRNLQNKRKRLMSQSYSTLVAIKKEKKDKKKKDKKAKKGLLEMSDEEGAEE